MNHYECLSCKRTYLAPSLRACKNCNSGTAYQRLAGTVELPGFAGTQKVVAQTADIERAQLMTAQMRMPLGDISTTSGHMERSAPLFFGQGDNPSLFSL